MNDQLQQPTPAVVQQTTVIHVGNRKSVAGAVLLAFFFGPLGMIYSTVTGALVMFFVNIIVAIPTLGLGLFLTVPLGAVWAGISAHNHNENLGATQAVSSSTTTPAASASPPGWHPDPEGSDRLRYWDGARWTEQYANTSNGEAAPAVGDDDEAPTLAVGDGGGPPPSAEAVELAPLPESDEVESRTFCEACGQGVSAADKFCPGCGAQQEPVA